MCCGPRIFSFFFFNDTATTEIYTLSLHDALPISARSGRATSGLCWPSTRAACSLPADTTRTPPATVCCGARSEEHKSELQSHLNLVCRLLLEKKKKHIKTTNVR